jgi:hypothetical protein
MTIPNVNVEVEDFALGILPENIDGVHAAVGPCSAGSVNTIYGFNDPKVVKETLGRGKLVEKLIHHLSLVGGPVYAIRPNTTAGTMSAVAVARKSTSTGTVADNSSTPNDEYEAILKITRTGTLGTGAFQYSLDNGDVYSEEIAIPLGGSYTIPDSGIVLTFTPNGGPIYFEKDDQFVFTTTAPSYSMSQLTAAIDVLLADAREWEFLHVVGTPAPSTSAVTKSNGSAPTITITGTPTDYHDLVIEITTGDTLASTNVRFKWSKDGGATYTENVTGAATVVLTGTGLTANFAAGTYVANDTYTFNTYNPLTTLATTVGTKMTEAETAARYAFGVVELGGATDAILITATQNLSDKRVSGAANSEELVSSVSGRVHKRPAAWPYVARLSDIPISEHPGRIKRGALPGIVSLYRDENATPGLDAQRMVTLRKHIGRQGFYVTSGQTFAPTGSDYREVQNLRVMNKACRIARNGFLTYLNDRLRLDRTTGFILEADARAIEAYVQGQLEAALGDDVSGVTVTVNRTDNVLSTRTLRGKVRVLPHAYASTIEVDIGFTNPALQPTVV